MGLKRTFAISVPLIILLASCSNSDTFRGGKFDLYCGDDIVYSWSNGDMVSFFDENGSGYERNEVITFSWNQQGDSIKVTNNEIEVKYGKVTAVTEAGRYAPFKFENGYLLSKKFQYKGKIPDGELFSADVSITIENDYLSYDLDEKIHFNKNGTCEFTENEEQWGGTYTRDGDFLLVRDDMSNDYHFVVVDKTLYSSFYIPSENGIPDLFK